MSSKHRILICDDEEKIRKSLSGLLEDHGYEVISAARTSECLEIIAAEQPDLVILDIIMPDMDGIEVLSRIKEAYPDTEVIMITGYADKEKAVAALRLNVYDFVEKPFESKDMLITIEHCLNQIDLKRELKKKSLELEESEKKYRRIFDDSKDMIYVTDKEGKFVDINPAGAELLGYNTRQELLELESMGLLYSNPDDWKQMQEKVEKEGFVKDFAAEFEKKDKSQISVLITSTALRDEEGRLFGYEGIIRDVTETKKALEKTAALMKSIREAKEEWEKTFDTIEDAIFLVDKTYTIRRANQGLARLLEKNLTDIIGQKCYRLLHETKQIPGFCPRPLVVKTCSSQSREIWEPNLKRHLRINYYPIIGQNGRVREVIHVLRDITERKKAREEIEYLASVVRHSRDAIIATDLNYNITSWNKTAERIFGYEEKEAIGNSIDIIVPEQQRNEKHLIIKEIVGGEGIEHYETIRKTKDGGLVNVDLGISPIKDAKGKIIGISYVIRDITYQKQLEAKLFQAQKMESIGTLAGGIAHNFNNLLMGIQGYASLILLDIEPSHPHYEMLKQIEKQVKSGSHLTRQLLGLARSGKYEPKPTNLNELIERSSSVFGQTKKEIIIHKKFEKDLWTVEADHTQIEQVLLNTYVNAWQAMPGGGNLYLETSNVQLDESYVKPYEIPPGKYVKISITDTGVGMDKNIQERIFDPFFTTKEIGSGTGLGLASAYGIIKNHKGIINVYSQKGQGTTLNIYLPASEKPLSPTTKKISDQVRKGTETILLVDDEEPVRDTAKAILEYLGYTVLTAKDGKEALAMYKDYKDTIDLVLLDLIMPGMNGGEVYDRIKILNPKIKVILSSGYSLNGEAAAILERGADSFIQKPFSAVDLSQKIREVMNKIS